MTVNKKLEKALNILPAKDEAEIVETTVPVVATTGQIVEKISNLEEEIAEITTRLINTKDVKADFKFIREKMIEQSEKGAEAMNELLQLAKSSQDFEHFTAFAQLMKSLNETYMNLMDLNKSVAELEATGIVTDEPLVQKAGPTTINNNVIINPLELMKMLKGAVGKERGLEAAQSVMILEDDAAGLQRELRTDKQL